MFQVEHKYNKSIKIIFGNDIFDAMKKASLDFKFWQEIK